MSQTAAHLVDHVTPRVSVQPWVLSLPIPLHALLQTLITRLTKLLTRRGALGEDMGSPPCARFG